MSLKLASVSPVFSTDDVGAWLTHYRALGFDVEQYDGEYGFARRGKVEIHVSQRADHDPALTAGCAYIYVNDADALASTWRRAGVGRTDAPVDTQYGLREGAHVDLAGNLLRFGSRRR